MNEKITSLIRLQELDKDAESLRQAISKAGIQRQALQDKIASLAAGLESSKKSLTDALVQKKNLELEVDAKDQIIKKSNTELGAVKSNDAYKALLTQIEQAKKEKSALEDQILVLMETIENFQKAGKQAEAISRDQKASVEKQVADLDAGEAGLAAKLEAKKTERDAFAAGMATAERDRYEQIQRGRPGFVVVVPVNNMICGGCRTTMTADTVNQVMKGKDLVPCESCSRLLFIPPKVEAAKV